MNYYCFIPSKKRIELKYNRTHLYSEEHMNNEGRLINIYTIMKPELFELNNIIKNNVNICNRKFQYYEMQCKWKLVFGIDISIDVKSKRMYRISVLRHIFEKDLKNKINHYEKQGVKFSHI